MAGAGAVLLLLATGGCASIGSVSLCGDVDGKPLSITLTAEEAAAVERGEQLEAKVGIKLGLGSGCSHPEAAQPEPVELCGTINGEPLKIVILDPRHPMLSVKTPGTKLILGACREKEGPR